MASASVVTRTDPVGIMLKNGYRALIGFERDPDASVWEKSVGTPPYQGPDLIDITTQWNDTWRTKYPGALLDTGELTVTCAYDPVFKTNVLQMININQAITITYPDGSTESFWGVLRSFESGDLVENQFPEGTLTIAPTNYDPDNDVEAGPVIASVSGT